MKCIRINQSDRTHEQGFSLLELVIAVLVIGVVVSIALPALTRSRLNANDELAKTTVRTVSTAFETYRASAQPPSYPLTLLDLTASTPPYIDLSLTTDSSLTKSGHDCAILATSADTFSFQCSPATDGTTGSQHICIKETGEVFTNEAGYTAGCIPITSTTTTATTATTTGGVESAFEGCNPDNVLQDCTSACADLFTFTTYTPPSGAWGFDDTWGDTCSVDGDFEDYAQLGSDSYCDSILAGENGDGPCATIGSGWNCPSFQRNGGVPVTANDCCDAFGGGCYPDNGDVPVSDFDFSHPFFAGPS